MRNGEVWTGEAVSEIGIFGRIVGRFDNGHIDVLDSQEIGCMMRTKPVHTDEGGVNAGYAYVDCPYLADDDELEKPIKYNFTAE